MIHDFFKEKDYEYEQNNREQTESDYDYDDTIKHSDKVKALTNRTIEKYGSALKKLSE